MMKKPKNPSITYSFATPADKDQIRRLLSECGLPTLFIIFVIPALLMFFIKMEKKTTSSA